MSYDVNNPSTKGRPCPIMHKECPGTIEGCAHWRVEEVVIENKPRMIQNCMYVLEYELARQAVVEQIRTAATVHHGTNQLLANFMAVRQGTPFPILSGNPAKDDEVLGANQGPPKITE